MRSYGRLALRATSIAFPLLAILFLVATLTSQPERADAKTDTSSSLELNNAPFIPALYYSHLGPIHEPSLTSTPQLVTPPRDPAPTPPPPSPIPGSPVPGGGAHKVSAPATSKTFRPAEASETVDAAIRDAAAKYNMPRWFYYALIQRESSFDPRADNGRDKGLTQLGGEWYTGSPYPEDLQVPDDTHQQYGWDMNFKKYGPWIRMSQVTPLDDYFDPRQNLDRFSTGYAVPAFLLFKRTYGLSDEETLRRVAFHWNKGMYATFDSENTDYLAPYDKYVAQFKPLVEAEDGIWNGLPAIR